MNDIKDVKPPLNLPDLWWLLWLLPVLAVIAAGIYFFLRYKNLALAPIKGQVPELPAWEKAYNQLEALRQENLLDKGLFKEFFTRVSDIARLYMENRFNIHAPHMTTEEFLYYLGISGHLNDTQKSSLKEFLNSCDMVKFAKYAPTKTEALKNFDLAKGWWMIPEFKTPLVLTLIPLLLAAFWYAHKQREGTSFRFSSLSLMRDLATTWRARWSFLPWVLRALVLVLLLIALASPRKLLAQSKLSSEGIDIVLALDVSGSMSAEDYVINGHRISRLDIIKSTVENFVKQRKDDRLGLIVFGSQAYTVCPLTTDHEWLLENLHQVRVGLIQDATAIGSGIATSLLRLKNSKAKSRIIVLLTDGVNNSGKIQPFDAAKMAQAIGIKVYTIGAGTTGIVPFPVIDEFGNKHYEQAQFDLDEDTLKKIAAMTGAQYFRAADTVSLRHIYAQIDKLEKTKINEKGYKQYEPLFWYFVVPALVLLALEIILTNTVFLKIP